MKNNMASLLGLLCIVATMNAVAGASNVFEVGESGVWRQPDANNTQMYNQWAAKNRFLVGDSLYFEYKEDSVLVVDKRAYYLCNTTSPITAFNDGKTVIKLDKPGPVYFISGAPDHCKNGQRLVVNVKTPRLTPQSPPSMAVPPQPLLTDSPSPSPNSRSGASVAVISIPVLLALAATTLVTIVGGAP